MDLKNTGQPLPAIGCFDQLSFFDALPMPVACAIQDVPAIADAVVKELIPMLVPNAPEGKPQVVPTLMSFNKAYLERVGTTA
jgi:hypothetical protein